MTSAFPSASQPAPSCELCRQAGGELVWARDEWRVIRAIDADFPGFYRVVHREHVAEFSDLSVPQRERCMTLVVAVERVLVERLRPTKVNLAAFGNMVPHLHWHVIARFDWDSHFPQPVWGTRQRSVEQPAAADRLACDLVELDAAVRAALDAI